MSKATLTRAEWLFVRLSNSVFSLARTRAILAFVISVSPLVKGASVLGIDPADTHGQAKSGELIIALRHQRIQHNACVHSCSPSPRLRATLHPSSFVCRVTR